MHQASFFVRLKPFFSLWLEDHADDSRGFFPAWPSLERSGMLSDCPRALLERSAGLCDVLIARRRRYICFNRQLSILVGNAPRRERRTSCRGRLRQSTRDFDKKNLGQWRESSSGTYKRRRER